MVVFQTRAESHFEAEGLLRDKVTVGPGWLRCVSGSESNLAALFFRYSKCSSKKKKKNNNNSNNNKMRNDVRQWCEICSRNNSPK